jgi:hypothetical protein
MLAAVRQEAADAAKRMQEEAEREVRSYVERRHREADRLVDAARARRGGGGAGG